MHESAKWDAAILTLSGFGLALGLNPALYGALADTLARGESVGARLRWMLGGLAVGATILLVALHSFNPKGLVSVVRGRVDAALFNTTADLIAGIIFLVAAAAIVVWKIRVPPLPPRATHPPKLNAQSFSFFTLGLSCSTIGFTTLPIMYLTSRIVVSFSGDPLLNAAAYGVFLVGLGAPFIALAWAWTRCRCRFRQTPVCL